MSILVFTVTQLFSKSSSIHKSVIFDSKLTFSIFSKHFVSKIKIFYLMNSGNRINSGLELTDTLLLVQYAGVVSQLEPVLAYQILADTLGLVHD